MKEMFRSKLGKQVNNKEVPQEKIELKMWVKKT